MHSERSGSGLAGTIAALAGVVLAALGVWAMVAPQAFFDSIANFDPYNQHLIQDIGAFQIGLGAVLLLASMTSRPDALAVALLGVGIGSSAHLVSHLVGRDLGGRPAVDIPFFVALGALLLGTGVARWRSVRRRED